MFLQQQRHEFLLEHTGLVDLVTEARGERDCLPSEATGQGGSSNGPCPRASAGRIEFLVASEMVSPMSVMFLKNEI